MPSRWANLAPVVQIPRGTNKAFKVDGLSVLVCHAAAGLYAIENRCSHQLATLEGGKLRGASIFCPKHGAQFDLRTGQPIGPLTKLAIQTYELRIDEGGNVEVQIPMAKTTEANQPPSSKESQ